MEPIFPWFGGKRKVAHLVWARFGDPKRYIEPFFGGGATLLGRPNGQTDRVEIVNDKDALVTNFWRSAKGWPSAVTDFASDLYSENDLHARNKYLIDALPGLQTKIEADPFYCDTRIAGWWLQGICMWIAAGYAQRNTRNLPRISDSARRGFLRHVRDGTAQSVMEAVSLRLRDVTVCSGDWRRIVSSESALGRHGDVAIFLDPPYADTANRDPELYRVDSLRVANDVREWAIAHGDDPRVKIALCGNVGEHTMPESWTTVYWERGRAFGSSKPRNEVIYFSPHCIDRTTENQLSIQAG